MLYWCLLLFVLGVVSFFDNHYNFGHVYRSANSVLFMLVSLGLLVRTKMLMKFGDREKMKKEFTQLRIQSSALKHRNIIIEEDDLQKLEDEPEKKEDETVAS